MAGSKYHSDKPITKPVDDLFGRSAFAHGQTYVALSRCVSLNGLFLDSEVRRKDIIVDPDIVEFMRNAKATI